MEKKISQVVENIEKGNVSSPEQLCISNYLNIAIFKIIK